MTRPQILEPRADRYASTAMLNIWSPEAKIIAERKLWTLVLEFQIKHGAVTAPDGAVAAYEACIENICLDSIREREVVLKHDVMARIEEFNVLASQICGEKLGLVHSGMTSRDLTENVEQSQALRSMMLVYEKLVAVLDRLANKAVEYHMQPMAGRSHNVAAQMTTLGKRFTNTAEELLEATMQHHHSFMSYPLRGIKGSVGTQQDMLDLLKDEQLVAQLEREVAKHLGFTDIMTSVGQVYPRSLDFNLVSSLVQIGAVASSFSNTLRLMAGQELCTEGFKEGQAGSSAMPHKMNARTSERINSLYADLCGELTKLMVGPAGGQWNEGDVSCSMVRRTSLQGAFFAIDGLLEAWLTVLDGFGAYPAMMNREIQRYLPFLATTKMMMAAVKTGMDRADVYPIIQHHAKEAALAMRETGVDENPLLTNLANDDLFPLSLHGIKSAIGEPIEFIGLAESQVTNVVKQVQELCGAYPDAIAYVPEEIL